MAGVGTQLVQALASKGGKQALDMSMACMSETIDAIGMTGFNKAFHNVQAFKNDQAPETLTVSRQLIVQCAAWCALLALQLKPQLLLGVCVRHPGGRATITHAHNAQKLHSFYSFVNTASQCPRSVVKCMIRH